MTVLGQVFELTPTDKLPSVALKTIFGVGAPLAANPEYLLIVGSKASSGGTLTADDEVRDILADGDEVTLFGDAGSEGARMVHMAQQIGGVQIKVAACSISAGVAATAKAVIDGVWTSAGSAPLQFWVGGQVVEESVLAADTPQTFAERLAATSNAKETLPASAAAAAGTGTEWIVTWTWKSLGFRGNDGILYADTTYKPAGMTVTLGGDVGGTVVSDPGPWLLDNGATLSILFNAGGAQLFTIQATPALTTGAGATYAAVPALDTLTLDLNGQTVIVVFTGAEATQAAFHATINSFATGYGVASNVGGQTRITTVAKGSAVTGSVVAGSAAVLASLGLAAPTAFTNAGPNNVAETVQAGTGVTAAEWVTIMAAITNGTAEDDAGALRLTSTTTGPTGTAKVEAVSTADTTMGFDNLVHAGGVGGGATVASGGIRFTGGAGTEDVTNLLATLEVERYYTVAWAQRDPTNVARIKTALAAKAGPLVRKFEQHVFATTDTLAVGTTLAQTTLNDVRTESLWMEEGETPAEEQAAWLAAVRHQRELGNPNTKYDGFVAPFVPQRAASKRPNRATQVAALDVGLTVISTERNVCRVARAITTRTLTPSGGADAGTIDVGASRTPDKVNELIGARWLQYTDAEDPSAYHYIRNDPAEGEEADVPAGTTFPRAWKGEVMILLKTLEGAPNGWITDVDANPTVVNFHPTSVTPRFVQYTPVVVTPQTHQLEGTIAQVVFQPQT